MVNVAWPRETVDLNLVAKESLQLVKTSLPPHIQLEFRHGDSPVYVTANSIKLMQVLINLMSNAIQAMGASSGKIVLVVKQRDDLALIEVTDQGQGIPQELREKIFDPFFTTRPSGEGTGMGLAIVHNIVQSLSGDIRFETGSGGTSFFVDLPVAQDEPACLPKSETESVKRKPGTRIIVVDDEPAVLDVEMRVLQLLGYEVTGFTNAREALNCFQEQPNSFDLLLTDMVMPGISGMELLESIRTVRQNFPAVVCSGYDLENEFATYPHLKRSVVQLNKPITSRALASAINYSLGTPE